MISQQNGFTDLFYFRGPLRGPNCLSFQLIVQLFSRQRQEMERFQNWTLREGCNCLIQLVAFCMEVIIARRIVSLTIGWPWFSGSPENGVNFTSFGLMQRLSLHVSAAMLATASRL